MSGETSAGEPIVELRNVSKSFGSVRALEGISLAVKGGEVCCLLGDNGAGKSTLIKILSGVHAPDSGEMLLDGKPVRFASPRDALDRGIATVYQDLATVPLMSIMRNFFMGREPVTGWGPWQRFNHRFANAVASDEMAKIGIRIRDPAQAVGTLSGGERQCVAIARAVYFGARVLILDEPTSALGVKQASMVLRYVAQARAEGLAVIFISHNVHHAYPVGDRFLLLNRGRSMGTFAKSEVTREQVTTMMAGGTELAELEGELEKVTRAVKGAGNGAATAPAA
jgi:simple sugar transport system ATP-binding protein